MGECTLRKSEGVLAELYEADEPVRVKFQNTIAESTVKFSQQFAPAYCMFENFYRDCDGTIQRGLVGGLMHGVLDDLLTSVKLLLSGKLSASGNLARQSMEGICMAIMSAHEGPLQFKQTEAIYWKLLNDEDKRSEGNMAPWQLLANFERLGLNENGTAQLKKMIETHHPHSHAGRLAMANRIDLSPGGQMYFGGHFDEAKLVAYQAEMAQRISICRWADETLQTLWPLVQALPKVSALR